MNETQYKTGIKISIITIICNIFLSFLKIFVGFLALSSALIADGIHSLSDVFTTFGVILGLKLSNKKADKEHPYGHEKIESLSALFLSIMLFVLALAIAYSGSISLITKNYSTPDSIAIYAAILSIFTKELMYRYTIKYSKKLNSMSLKADAWHHRSDAFSSIGVLIGIIGSKLGYPFLDPLVTLFISMIIIKVSCDIFKQSVGQLIDESASEEIINNITEKILSVKGVKKIDLLKTRKYANKIYVDLEISVDANLSVEDGHYIAFIVHNLVEEDSSIKHCMIHVNPYKRAN